MYSHRAAATSSIADRATGTTIGSGIRPDQAANSRTLPSLPSGGFFILRVSHHLTVLLIRCLHAANDDGLGIGGCAGAVLRSLSGEEGALTMLLLRPSVVELRWAGAGLGGFPPIVVVVQPTETSVHTSSHLAEGFGAVSRSSARNEGA